jgi:hypothetical protein
MDSSFINKQQGRNHLWAMYTCNNEGTVKSGVFWASAAEGEVEIDSFYV